MVAETWMYWGTLVFFWATRPLETSRSAMLISRIEILDLGLSFLMRYSPRVYAMSAWMDWVTLLE
jgi:hypothetical protein